MFDANNLMLIALIFISKILAVCIVIGLFLGKIINKMDNSFIKSVGLFEDHQENLKTGKHPRRNRIKY